jgi:hypothetical protein
MYAALMTWFMRRPDDSPVGTETCSFPFIKYDLRDVNCLIILVIRHDKGNSRFPQRHEIA